MSEAEISDLELLERRVYKSSWDDGLLDICIGVGLLITGIFWVTGQSEYGAFAAPVMIPIWLAARKRFSEPRMGAVTFSAKRTHKEKTLSLGLFLIGVLMLAGGVTLYFLVVRNASPGVLGQFNIVAGLPAALLSVPAIIVAFALRLPRFLFYAVLLLLSAFLVIVLDAHPGWAFMPSAILFVCIGTGLLLQFMTRYPKRG